MLAMCFTRVLMARAYSLYGECLFVQTMLGSNARDFQAVVVFQFGNVVVNLCLVASNGVHPSEILSGI